LGKLQQTTVGKPNRFYCVEHFEMIHWTAFKMPTVSKELHSDLRNQFSGTEYEARLKFTVEFALSFGKKNRCDKECPQVFEQMVCLYMIFEIAPESPALPGN
jgi:hypothetical protein